MQAVSFPEYVLDYSDILTKYIKVTLRFQQCSVTYFIESYRIIYKNLMIAKF